MTTTKQNASGVPVNEATVETVRKWLASRYERRYRQKMADRLPVNLHFHASLHGIRDGDRSSFIEVAVEEAGGQLRKVFQQTKGRLLLLGAPGAGKTMQLIQLAQDLLMSEPEAMPVILNLATWTSDYPTLLDWLKKSLPYELGTNEPLALKLLAHRRVILLLDGFDEIGPQHRVSFFEKMAEYLAVHLHQEFVISSRIDEYLEAAAEKTPPIVHQPVEVAALSIERIREKLRLMEVSGEPAARRFSAALDADSLLGEAAAKPFYFNCLQMLFALKPWSEWRFSAATQEGREAEIAERFIQQELKKCSKPNTRQWLGFLASRMEEREMVRFELRDLQYGWWKWGRWELIVAWLVYVLSAGIIYWLITGLSGGWWLFLGTGLFIGVKGQKKGMLPDIKTRDQIDWSSKSFWYRLNKGLIGLMVWVLIGLLLWGAIGGLVVGLIAGLVIPLIIDYFGSEDVPFLQISHPYQRFTASAKNLWFSILQHWHLRHLLARKGLLPHHLVHFLNEMALLEKNSRGEWPRRRFTTEQVYLMETDGATWRFRHRIIQEWFAKQGGQ